jgi:hypothetical protein
MVTDKVMILRKIDNGFYLYGINATVNLQELLGVSARILRIPHPLFDIFSGYIS